MSLRDQGSLETYYGGSVTDDALVRTDPTASVDVLNYPPRAVRTKKSRVTPVSKAVSSRRNDDNHIFGSNHHIEGGSNKQNGVAVRKKALAATTSFTKDTCAFSQTKSWLALKTGLRTGWGAKCCWLCSSSSFV